MKTKHSLLCTGAGLWLLLSLGNTPGEKEPVLPRAGVDGLGPGWRPLGEKDFINVNCDPDTWTWKDGVAHSTGSPTGVIRSRDPYTNFEIVTQWRHLRA